MLKAIRKKTGFSQKQVANAAGISQPTYSNIENGKRNPTLKTLRKIAEALGCSVGEILDERKEENDN